MDPLQSSGLINPDAGLPQHMPPTMQAEPSFPSPAPSMRGSAADGHKRELLQKLMTNLLSKPGRSMHEIINGVKSAIGAYKNYAKEWDSIGGAVAGAAAGAAFPAAAGAAMGARGIQGILQQVKQKKDGAGGPGDRPSPMGNPNGMPSQAQGTPALGNPVRPPMPAQAQVAPVQPSMPAQAQSAPVQPSIPPQAPVAPSRPTALPTQAQGSPSLPTQAFGNPQVPSNVPPTPQPQRPPQMPSAMPTQAQGSPVLPTQAFGNPQAPANLPPIGSIPQMPEIAGQPQTSTFNRPAPVNSLGIFGY